MLGESLQLMLVLNGGDVTCRAFKQVRAGVVLRWGRTTREGPVLRFFYTSFSSLFSFLYLRLPRFPLFVECSLSFYLRTTLARPHAHACVSRCSSEARAQWRARRTGQCEEEIRTENTTNKHENVTETQRGETVANGHSSCCLCIALGEQHAPCCGDARVDAAMRAYHTPPACQRVAPVHKSESSTAGSRRHITFHHGLATHSPLMHAYVTEPGLTTKADFSESGTPNLTPFLSAHPRSLSVYISPTRQLGLYTLTMHF